MAKGDTQETKTPESGMTSQLPQQNQTLQGNPSTDTNAQTRWMDPTSSSDNTGVTGTGVPGGKVSQPVQDGTMLGQITAGQVGQYMPGGYDQGKFNDPNKHDEKYDVGRIVSKYPPGPQGLEAAMKELGPMGFKLVNAGSGKVQSPNGSILDIGTAFGSGNPGQMSWGYNPQGMPGQSQGSPSGMIGGQQNQPFYAGSQQGNDQGNFMQQMMQQMLNRQNTFNQIPQSGSPKGNQESIMPVNQQPQIGSMGQFPMMNQQPQSGSPKGNYSPMKTDQQGNRIS